MSGEVRRQAQINRILEHLRLKHWCGVIAPRLSGKTTLAKQLEAELTREHPAWQTLRVEFQPAKTLEEAWMQVKQGLTGNAGFDETIPDRRIADLLASFVRRNGGTYCLVLDALDVLPDEVLRTLAAQLRRFRIHGGYGVEQGRLHCVLLGATKLLYVANQPHSPLANLMETIALPDLTVDDAGEAFSGKAGGIPLSPEARAAIFAQTGGHPYLVDSLAKSIKTHRLEPSAAGIEETARALAERWASLCLPLDPCFEQAVRCMESDRRVFEAVLDLLGGNKDRAPVPGLDDMVALSGAVAERDGVLAFRGQLFAYALARYMDDLRKADYWCLHGDWSASQRFFGLVNVKEIAARRGAESDPVRRIMDLYLGIARQTIQPRRLADAEQLAATTSRYFFGADFVRLWRVRPEAQRATIACQVPAEGAPRPGKHEKTIAAAAARRQAAFALANNQGIIQPIGDDPATANWSLELRFQRGLPLEGWVESALRYTKTTLHAILVRARSRQARARRQRAQRKLIHEISLRLQRATELEEVFSLIVNGIPDRLGFECAQLSLVFPSERRIRAVRCNGAFECIREETNRDLDGGDIFAIVVRTRKREIIPDCKADLRCEQTAIDKSKLKSLIVVPLFDGEEAVGVFQVGDTQRNDAFDDADADLVEMLADTAAIAIRVAREREALERVSEAAGNATTVVGASGRIISCNRIYREFFGVRPGDQSPLTSLSGPEVNEPLVRIAFQRGRPFSSVRQIEGRSYIATVVGLKDTIERFAGGVEIVGTKSPLYGLTEALSRMLGMSSVRHLGQAMVDCLCHYLGYSCARFYEMDAQGTRLVSRCSHGMDEDRTRNFGISRVVLMRSQDQRAGDGFECLRLDAPVIMVRAEFASEKLPVREMYRDSQGRLVVMLADEDVQYIDELDKHDLREWIDVPLGRSGMPLGMLSVDLKGSEREFGLEDVELLGLFGRWASAVLAQVVQLERTRREAELKPDFRLLGEPRSLAAMAWTFLVNVTVQGGPEFNRVALFLKHAQSERIHGYLCHGAPNKLTWERELKTLQILGNRPAFVAATRDAKLSSPLDPEEAQRLDRFRSLVIPENDPQNPFSCAVSVQHPIRVDAAEAPLRMFFETLGWQPTATVLVCPLVSERECEGLLYVDRAFSADRQIDDGDQQILEILAVNLATVVRPLRLAEQLRSQILAVSHTTLTPIAAIHSLAEALRRGCTQEAVVQINDLILAESARSADTLRRLFSVARLEAAAYRPVRSMTDLRPLLEERIAPYVHLLREDSVPVRLSLTEEPVYANVDSLAVGDVFAELASNAMIALRSPAEGTGSRCFCVSCGNDSQFNECRIVIENSGPRIPVSLQERVFDLFVSTMGSTGVGLWLARRIVTANDGRISYRVSPEGLSQFEVVFPRHSSQ